MRLRDIALILGAMAVIGISAPARAADSDSANPEKVASDVSKETQSPGGNDPKYLVPDSPAFAILGVSGEKAIHPQSARAFALSLLNGVDGDGNLQNGIAIDYAPFFHLPDDHTLDEYRNNNQQKFLSRLSLSFATAKGEGENDKSLKAAFGIRAVLFDTSDVRTDKRVAAAAAAAAPVLFSDLDKKLETARKIQVAGQVASEQAQCLHNLSVGKSANDSIRAMQLTRCNDAFKQSDVRVPDCLGSASVRVDDLKTLTEASPGKFEMLRECVLQARGLLDIALQDEVARVEADARARWQRKLNEFRSQDWNNSSMTLGVAPVWYSPDGKYNRLRATGIAAYGALSYGFGDIDLLKNRMQIIVSGKFRSKDQVVDPTDKTKKIEQDTTNAALQFRFRGPDIGEGDHKDPSLIFNAEVDYDHADRKTLDDDDFWTFTAGADIRVAQDLVVKLSIGGQTERKNNGETSFVMGRLKWAI